MRKKTIAAPCTCAAGTAVPFVMFLPMPLSLSLPTKGRADVSGTHRGCQTVVMLLFGVSAVALFGGVGELVYYFDERFRRHIAQQYAPVPADEID